MHHFSIIVHITQKNGLIADWHACVSQLLARLTQGMRALVGMVDVDTHPNRAMLFEDLAELWRYPLREEDRYARAYADEFYMRDFVQFA